MAEQEWNPGDLIAQAQEHLEAARGTGHSGTIGLAMVRLAEAYRIEGDVRASLSVYDEALEYLSLAANDETSETQRWLRMTSPGSPPPGASDIDPNTLRGYIFLCQAEILLELGDRSGAKNKLDRADDFTKGFGKRALRKRAKELRDRLDAPIASLQPNNPETRQPTRNQPDTSTAAEKLGAAQELSDTQPADAMRLALQVVAGADDDPLLRARGRQIVGTCLTQMGQYDDALPVLLDAWKDFLLTESYDYLVQIVIHISWLASTTGVERETIPVIERTLRQSEGRLSGDDRAALLIELGSKQDRTGAHDAANESFTTATGLAESTETKANATHGLAVVLATNPAGSATDRVEAISLLEDASRLYTEIDLPAEAAGCQHEIAATFGRLGSAESALRRYEAVVQAYNEMRPEFRNEGWAESLANAERHVTALTNEQFTPDLFDSGGHLMAHN